VEAFDAWRREGGIYPTLQTFEVDENVQDRHDTDPEGTYYVSAKINGTSRVLRVPVKAQLSWADGIKLAQAAPAQPAVTFSEAELRRKRAEWEENERMKDQSQAELQAWRRSRSADAEQAVPRVGAALRPQVSAADELARTMRVWHRYYAQRAAAVSLALSRFGMASREIPPDMMRQRAACKEMNAASQALLADPQALAAPLASVSGPLATAYGEIHAAALACLAERADEQAAHLSAARGAMSEAGAALRPFQLSP
jgi:hypothetical protein